MSIDTSGKWWKGSSPDDLEEYLRALSEEGYPIDDFRLSQCPCGSNRFLLEVNVEEGLARRVCERCGTKHFICDSEENWSPNVQMRKFKCVTCKSKIANVGVGFSLYEDKQAVRWLYVGERCAECGTLGSMVDWKVGYEPSLQLIDQA